MNTYMYKIMGSAAPVNSRLLVVEPGLSHESGGSSNDKRQTDATLKETEKLDKGTNKSAQGDKRKKTKPVEGTGKPKQGTGKPKQSEKEKVKKEVKDNENEKEKTTLIQGVKKKILNKTNMRNYSIAKSTKSAQKATVETYQDNGDHNAAVKKSTKTPNNQTEKTTKSTKSAQQATVDHPPENGDHNAAPVVVEHQTPRSPDVLLAMDCSSLWLWDRTEWERQPDYPDPDVDWMCLCAAFGGIMVMGGTKDGAAVPYCFYFSLRTRSWREIDDMMTARYDASAAVLDDQIMLVGGRTRRLVEVAHCEKYDLKYGWSATASLLKAMAKPLVASAAERIFVLPRESSIDDKTRIQRYNPKTNRFSWVAKLPRNVKTTRGACLLGTAGGMVYLLGGTQRLAVEYNPVTDQWAQLLSTSSSSSSSSSSSPSSPLCHRYTNLGCCALVHAGKILLCGGCDEDHDRTMMETLDPDAKEQWSTMDVILPFGFHWDYSHVAGFHRRTEKLTKPQQLVVQW